MKTLSQSVLLVFDKRDEPRSCYSLYTGNESVFGFVVHATIMIRIPNVFNLLFFILFLCPFKLCYKTSENMKD